MKQLLLILLLFVPVCVCAQVRESFDGPEITSNYSWQGDLDQFAIVDGWLVSRASPEEKSASIELPIDYAPNMTWEFEVRIAYKPSNFNHIRMYVYTDDTGMDYFVQVGNNDHEVMLRKVASEEDSPQTLVKTGLGMLEESDVFLRVKLSLEMRKTWFLYVEEAGKYRLLGSYEEEAPVSSSAGGSLRFECRYSKTHVNDFACNFIEVSMDKSAEEPDEEPEEEEEEEEPDVPEEPEEEPDVPDTPSFASGSVRINEVMANPKGSVAFPETEYVELYNTTSESVDLTGWSFVYGDKETALAALRLEAGGYAVLYRSGREIHVDSPGQAMPLERFPSALANTGKELALLDPSRQTVDRVAYDEAEAGVSWERSGDGFYLSTDPRGGTPGSANSSPGAYEEPEEEPEPSEPDEPEEPVRTIVLPGEIIFNELLPNPYPDGSEYIELYNRSDRVLPLSGLSIALRKADGSLRTRYPLSSITGTLEPGGFALLSKDIEGVERFYMIVNPSALHELKLPVLANTSSTLVLLRSEDEVVIDEVCYSAEWHAAFVKEEKGVALERIDPDGASREASNWTSASSLEGYGTPGYRNSQFGKPAEENPTGIESPVYEEATGDYAIPYRLEQAGYVCRAWIYDASGRLVREVVNHESLGTNGVIRWNGLSGDGSKARTGVYIFYAELIHPNGTVKRRKEVFLVK